MNNKIVVVDDHPAVRLAVRLLLASEGFNVVAETGDGLEAISLVEKHSPSAVVLDIGIHTMDGLAVIGELVDRKSPVKIVVLSGSGDRDLEMVCRQLGAHGFVGKSSDLPELIWAIRTVRAGEAYFSEFIKFSELKALLQLGKERLDSLSDRETVTMRYLLSDRTMKDIAKLTGLSERAVGMHKNRLLKKLGVGSLDELRSFSQRNGFI